MSNDNTSSNNKRIAKNTLLLYFRMILVMLASLYTARIMLEALGVEDYGLYNVVAGVITLFTFLNATMTTTTSRYLTYELGRGDVSCIRTTFSSSFKTHLLLATIIMILGETAGVYMVNDVLSIPANRLFACNIVFQTVIVSAGLQIVQVPYSALVISHEKMGVYAYLGIFDVVAKLAVCFAVKYIEYDKLILLAVLQLSVTALIAVFYYAYCKAKFNKLLYISRKIDKAIFVSMLGFTAWSLMGSLANMLKNQGINILINLFFGSAINAANAIAYRINSAVMGFTSNFTTALNPQITKMYASGQYDEMRKLIYSGGKYTFFMLMLLGIPIMLEIDFILKIWLGDNVPEYTSIMTVLVLALSMVETFTYTIGCAIQATGCIRNYQLVISGLSLLNFPLSYVLFMLGCPPYSALAVSVAISAVMLFSRLYFMKTLLGIPPMDYISKVFLRTFVVAVLCIIPSLFICYYLKENTTRFFIVCGVTTVSNLLGIYFLGINSTERQFVQSIFHRMFNKLVSK